MTQQDLDRIMFANTQMVCKDLTDDELAGLNIVALLDSDPTHTSWYPKAATLFTDRNGTRMHSETKRALKQIVAQRLPLPSET